MDIHFVVSNPNAGPFVCALCAAATRKGVSWSMFFTNDGVVVVNDPEFLNILKNAEQAVCCHDSWNTHVGGKDCPIEIGSQTNNSALVAQAKKIIGL